MSGVGDRTGDEEPLAARLWDQAMRAAGYAAASLRSAPDGRIRPKGSLVAIVAGALLVGCANQSAEDTAVRGAIGEGLQVVGPFGSEGRDIRAPQTSETLRLIGFAAVPGWRKDNHAAALASFRISCDRIGTLRNTEILGDLAGDLSDWREVCAAARSVPAGQARRFFEQNFTPTIIAPDKKATLTAYYEPELPARRRPDRVFKFPLHAKPPELERRGAQWGRLVNGRLQPYFTREDIYRGALNGRGLEIAYLADPIDAFFLQVQGSGRLRMGDGSVLRLGYAAKNGLPYNSVGRELLRRGWSSSGSKDAIEAFVRANPGPGFELLSHNQSYIFFREMTDLDPRGGPQGALGVQLSDLRSIAVDRRYTPLGAPVWIEGDTAVGPIQQLMVAQDTGSAILGPQRADLFWGSGEEAGRIAGRTKSVGRLITLLPNALVARLLATTS